jgi:nickel/cobalt exporter
MRFSSVQAAMTVVTVVLAAVAIDSASHVLLAQNPFGGSRSPIEPQMSGVVGWLLTKQSEFYREMSSTIRAAKNDGSAVWSLLAISFLYGIFHAAGPGHGKAVISSYLVANQETARRGIILSFVLPSLVAVLIVGIGAWFLNATAKTMCGSERIIEIASYTFIAVFGARLLWIKGGGLVRALRVSRSPIGSQMPALAFADAPLERHAANDHSHRNSPFHSHDDGARNEAILHEHGSLDDSTHVHDAHCGHSHGPQPGDLAGPGGWQRGFSAILTVGIRPCSGAILVLVFALAQGLFWAGIAATLVMGLGIAITVATIAILSIYAKDIALRLMTTHDGGAALLSRGLEVAAAGIVLLFGVGLLLGYVAAERVTCF